MKNILNISEEQFVENVIEASKNIPILVDFWAPWCGPCKQLSPILEGLANKKKGKFTLVKINIDENQNIARQLNIQSIPTVYGFVNGRPIDGFNGLQSESKIESMIDKMIDATPGNEIPKLVNEAEELLKEQKYEEAQSAFENLIGMDPGNIKIIIGLLRSLMQLYKYDNAKEMFESLNDEILKNEEIIKIKKLLDSLDAASDASIEDLKLRLSSEVNNLNLRFELAVAYLSNNDAENGFKELLEIFKTNPKWNEEAAKKKLLEFFDLLGPADPNVLNARRKLSSLMFK